MTLNEIKTLLAGTIKQAFINKKTLDKFDDTTGTLKYNGVPVNNVPVFVADDAPVGNIIAFMGNAAPKDYLICDGSEYNIADYPLLAQHILNEFGSYNYFGGDGTTTFAVPDLRGEFLRGTGTGDRNTGSGDNVGVHQDPTYHHHLYKSGSGDLRFYGKDASAALNRDSFHYNDGGVATEAGYKLAGTSYTASAGSTHYSSRPTNTSVLYCIKYQITQNNISKDMVNYSLEEQVIGSWIDGKPLYEKTIETTMPQVVTDGVAVTEHTDVSELNIDLVAKIEGFAYYDSAIVPINAENCIEKTIFVFYNTVLSSISKRQNHVSWNNSVLYITIRYTKTTDAENSFTPDMLSNISTFGSTVTDEDVNDVIGGM